MGNPSQPIEILMAEDNPDDVDLTMEALNGAKIRNRIHVVENGVEVMAFLRREGVHVGAPRPDLILLDLNMPRMDGREVLEAINADESLSLIPTVVLTTSQADEDVLRAYRLNANCYITKPLDFDQFVDLVRRIERFWFSVVRFPKEN
jgi:CheY-like chemotaxis protein